MKRARPGRRVARADSRSASTLDEARSRDGEQIRLARLQLEHPPAVGAPDRLGADERHRVQRGDRQQLARPAGDLRPEVEAMDRVEVVDAGTIAREPRRVGVHVGHKQVRGRNDRRAPPRIANAALVGAIDTLTLALGDVRARRPARARRLGETARRAHRAGEAIPSLRPRRRVVAGAGFPAVRDGTRSSAPRPRSATRASDSAKKPLFPVTAPSVVSPQA